MSINQYNKNELDTRQTENGKNKERINEIKYNQYENVKEECLIQNFDLFKQKLNEISTTKNSDEKRSSTDSEKTIDEKYKNQLKENFKLIHFIIESGLKLNMSDISMATATVMYHKFFKLCSFDKFDPYLIATASIYLASKVEEEHLKLRDIINVCYRSLHVNKSALEICDQYWSLRNGVIQCELLIVRVLSFNLSFDHPHKYLLHYLESLREWIPLDKRKHVPVPETCWHILRDILHTDILLRYRPQEIAISLIYLVFMCYGIKVPFNDIAQKCWWKALDEKISRSLIIKIIEEMICVYEIEDEVK